MSFKCIIFDMDGTLIDSKKAICEAINIMRRKSKMPGLSDEFIISGINDPNFDIAKKFYNIEKITRDLYEEFEIEYAKSYAKYAKIYPQSLKILEFCKKENYKIALASNAPKSQLEKILQHQKVFEYFDFIVGCDKNTPPKPDPAMLFLIKQKYENHKFIFLGDSLKDYLASKSANIDFVSILWGFSDEIFGEKFAKNIDELKAILTSF